MRRAEGPCGKETGPRPQQAGDGMDRCRIERLLEGQRRKNARETARHHRLARARRTDEQEVMSACCGNLERAAREQLTAYVRQVGPAGGARETGQAGRAVTTGRP